jgi:hypothetical protein
MAITPGKLVKLYQADPDAYEDELQTLLGVTTDPETGYRRIQDPVIRPRSVSILDVGEAFVGREALRRIYDRRYGLAGGRARTAPPADWTFEEVGGGALGPSQFAGLNAWLATVDGLLGAELLERYTFAVQLARELIDWRMDVRIQEGKLIRYGATTAPADDILPGQEFPSGDLGADWVRANRMKKQAMALAVTWEAAHFDQTDSLIEAADGIADRFALVISERTEKAIWGITNTYNYKGTITNTYRTTGSYVNQITNELVSTTSLDLAEQQLLAQTDPVTGLEIDTPAMTRVLVSTNANRLTATRLANPLGVNIGSVDDPERLEVQGFYQPFQVYPSIRAVRLMVAGLGITTTQASKRWVWGDTKGAFQYRSAKDITTYRYTLQDTAALARRDVLMELDCSEMGDVTVKEPRKVTLNIKDA